MKEELKTTKKRAILRFGLQVLLFFAVLLALYFQLQDVKWTSLSEIHIEHEWALITAVLLLTLNQGVEYVKWRLFTRHLINDRSATWKSFMAGLASGFLSPNGWGNVFGRMLYFNRRNALQIVLVTALGNLSQLLPTAIFGTLAIYFRNDINPIWFISSACISVVLLLFYFFGEKVFGRRSYRNKMIRHFKLMLLRFGYLRIQLLLLSIFRFLVFTAQFVLLFVAFGYTDLWLLVYSVWIIYILTSFIPSLWSGKLLIRETAALLVFKGTVVNSQADIIVICLLIWMINIVVPSLIGSFVLLPIKRKTK